MTNLATWQSLFHGSDVPELFTEWAWYGIVASSLDRRVWLGEPPNQTLMNLYTMLVCRPGVGKGAVTDKQRDLLMELKDTDGGIDRPAVLLGPDSTTYPDLTNVMASTPKSYKIDGMDDPLVYSSMTFILDEMTTLFQKDAEDIIPFLNTVYNGKAHRRSTKHNGKDFIGLSCVNITGGMTIDDLNKLSRNGIYSNGLASRFVIIYDGRAGGSKLSRPLVTTEWKAKWHRLKLHVQQLVNLKGQISNPPEFQQWEATRWPEIYSNPINKNIKMQDAYYARKNQLLTKLACLLHFSESATLTGPTIADYEAAAKRLEAVETVMHIPLMATGRNEMAQQHEDILRMIQGSTKPVTHAEVLMSFFSDAPNGERAIEESIKVLMATGRIVIQNGGYTTK